MLLVSIEIRRADFVMLIGSDSDALSTDGTIRSSNVEENFGSNYKRLQEVKRKYDPELVFNKWFAITPASTRDK